MKAAVVNESGKLEIRDVPMPQPGPYDVLVKICYGATCAGTDLHLMDGLHPHPVTFPTILGHESVGRVVEVGSKVTNLRVGQLISRVGAPAGLLPGLQSNWGGFAEFGIARDHWQMREDGLEPSLWNKNRVNQIIHPAIDEKTAPMIITWRETLSYINRLGVDSTHRVLVIGSGGNALSLTNHCCNKGAKVMAIGSPARKEDYRSLPLWGYLSYKEPELTEQVRELCAGEKFDYIIDGVGGDRTVNQLLPLLRDGGTLAVYGWNGRGGYGVNPFLAEHSFQIYANSYDEEESNAEVQSLILQGKLNASLWYNMAQPVELKDIAAAYDSLRRHEALKYLIKL